MRSEWMQGGRRISQKEIQQICRTVQDFGKLSAKELAATLCEHLGWYTVAGGLKIDACQKLLAKLEGHGLLRLASKRPYRPQRRRPVEITAGSDPRSPVRCTLKEMGRLWLEAVEGKKERRFNEYLQRYHPLGYRQPFGYRMRYFIRSDRGPLGCLLFGGAAKSLGARDRWIGWSESQRLQRLPWVVNLVRHLIFPWVQVRNLSSHVLAVVAAELPTAWERRWSYRPVLLETFVDPVYHEGSSYKAAGWFAIGLTTGEGLVRPGQQYRTTPKKIFLKPLSKDWQAVLCSELPPTEGLR
jgi:hypothetical protein